MCKYCELEKIDEEYYEGRINPAIEHECDAARVIRANGRFMLKVVGSGEPDYYIGGATFIKYCPWCGRKLGEEK